MQEPTIAEEHYAKVIAMWHGATMVVNNKTVAAMHGFGSWGYSPEQYMQRHWREYLVAARAIIESRS